MNSSESIPNEKYAYCVHHPVQYHSVVLNRKDQAI